MIKLIDKIKNCKKCDLHRTRTNVVVGEGPFDAKIMFIGEAPGYWEDQKGIPFCGKAGKILDSLLNFIGLNRKKVYITNIVKCRPPNNRDPTQYEKTMCGPYLDEQISLIKPKIIVTLGNHSTKYILTKFGLKEENISSVRGKVFVVDTLFGKIKIIPVFHPAVATYNPSKINELKEDFLVIKKALTF